MLVISVVPAFWFPNAIVIITSCGHRHIRPNTFNVREGDNFTCYCEKDTQK